MKEHQEFRRYNPFNWEQPRNFRWYQLTKIRYGVIEIIQRQPDLFSYSERNDMYHLRRRYQQEIREQVDKTPIVHWQSLIRELESNK